MARPPFSVSAGLPVAGRIGERPRADHSVPVRHRQRENEEHSVRLIVGADC